MNLLYAVILGTLFGFVLHRVGASNPQRIIDMLRLTDFHLMKTTLFGIAVASVLLFLGVTLGIIDPSHLSVEITHWGVVAGGLIMGLGWAVGGYCPGTGVAALGEGRKDAGFFVIGGLGGAFMYILVHGRVSSTGIFKWILAGDSTIAFTPNPDYPVIVDSIPGVATALVIAVVFTLIAWMLPKSSG
ncbi:MAG: YeeE/YedE thiosulfate transporter family protein [Deltaproteobacteria bacterium]